METETTAQKAKAIRTALKAAGIAPRSVSVKSSVFSMGASISVKVLDFATDLDAVKAIALPFAEIRRDEISGEILGGGNTYINVALDWKLRDLRARMNAACESMKADGLLTVA